jgi:murein DD-endopeptidase MepM/ murein hydrolase activator NlpD
MASVRRRELMVGAAVLLSLVTLPIPGVAAQENQPVMTTTTEPEQPQPVITTTTTVFDPAPEPPPPTTTTTAPGSQPAPDPGGPPPTEPPRAGPSPEPGPDYSPPRPAPVPVVAPPDSADESASDAPPVPVPVPPRLVPRPPTVEDALTNRAVLEQLAAATEELARAAAVNEEASARAVELEAQLAAKDVRLRELRNGQALAVTLLDQRRAILRKRAISIYTSGGVNRINSLLSVRNMNELVRRRSFVEAVSDQDRQAVVDYTTTREAANTDFTKEVEDLETTRLLAEAARREAANAAAIVASRQLLTDSLQASGVIVAGGFVFPVDEPYVFSSTFGAPRMTGTPYQHSHQGNDIFAPIGTPLRAVERGIITKVGTDTLGGTKLWLIGMTGTTYYYAHLSAYGAGIVDNVIVEAGDVVGYVGNTGNARTTPPHLHFEVHPYGGPAVDPYPLLRSASDATRAARALAAAPTISGQPIAGQPLTGQPAPSARPTISGTQTTP